MRKNLLLTSVAVLNTLATVAVPSVVSAETTDTDQNTNNETEVTPTKEDTSDSDAVITEASEDPDVATGNGAANTIVGPHVDKADPTVAHSMDMEGLEAAEANVLSRSWSSQQRWAESVGPMAQRSAQRYNLYASVMMAQAIIESGWGGSALALPPNHNLFGIKGSYNGQSVYMRTAEYSSTYGWYYINAAFAKYPTYEESFNDNGVKLRYGLTWNGAFYKGTWKENTRSYRDATAWLQGRYATAPNYASVLNNIIDSYDLTRWDSKPVPQEPEVDAGMDAPLNGEFFNYEDIGTIKNANGAKMYVQADPNYPTKRTLPNGSNWRVTGKVLSNQGELYFRVSTKEYVKAADIQLKSSTEGETTHKIIKATNPDSYAVPLVSFHENNKMKDSNRGLANDNYWAVDKTRVVDGHTYYRVSTNEWIKDTYATITQG
ncbi:glycoside hydrolase family 73 protein [Companilactobacillus ginsenosidimutans]|uniref:glycoside hydrolase family 73 protein n=1 Tax=Companilactobacillus ginsenosidimutans TaxID=1007676 RepID=UPI00069DD072|nr:glycoside hydrolase family 73 protein [Companilactobacillus ginsenosidimutans]